MPSWGPRFWSKVDQSGDCWLWQAAKDRHGYGRFTLAGKVQRAHRLAYEMFHGPIPDGMEIDHRCHTKHCVQPGHLRLATGKQNAENQAGPRSDSTSGVRGVTWAGKHGWRARAKHNGKHYSAGHHPTVEEAERAVVALRNRLFTHNDVDRPSY
jgi:hypothetical protein